MTDSSDTDSSDEMQSARDQDLKLMRLLDTHTFRFLEAETEPQHLARCAILSHRWESKVELTFDAYENFVSQPSFRTRHGVVDDTFLTMDSGAAMAHFPSVPAKYMHGICKVLKFCHTARKKGYDYAWIDTCCIDKSDGSNGNETQQAINSMWDYYSRCAHCFTYMNDVSMSTDDHLNDHRGKRIIGPFGKSEWFKRGEHSTTLSAFIGRFRSTERSGRLTALGWTLQEMLAAKDITFLDYRWRPMGSKKDFIEEISSASKISKRYLEADGHRNACIAVKLGWLSKRKTKFSVDKAYCMFGIFGVRLKTDYGEPGESAFRRLQEALIKKYPHDSSIFAWVRSPDGMSGTGLLAPWPSHFDRARCGHLVVPHNSQWDLEPSVSRDGNSVQIKVPAKLPSHENGADWNNALAATRTELKLTINCRTPGEATEGQDFIILHFLRNEKEQWRKVPVDEFEVGPAPEASMGSTRMTVFHETTLDAAPELLRKERGRLSKIKVGFKAAIKGRLAG